MRVRVPCLVLLGAAVLAGCGPVPDRRVSAEPGGRAEGRPAQAQEAADARPAPPGHGGAAPGIARDPTTAMGAAPSPVLGLAPAAAGEPVVDDALITARVRAQLAGARDLEAVPIDVDTRDGVVTLSGSVQKAATKARASEVARTVPGVRAVNDQLTLATG